jgi:hypothetical protein
MKTFESSPTYSQQPRPVYAVGYQPQANGDCAHSDTHDRPSGHQRYATLIDILDVQQVLQLLESELEEHSHRNYTRA